VQYNLSYFVALQKHVLAAQLLLKAAGAKNATDYILMSSDTWYSTALDEAAGEGCTEMVKLFLEAIPIERNSDLFR
jgi:ankyrin repeat protein